MRFHILSYILILILVPLSREGQAQITDRKGRVAGARFVHLRSGPGLDHPPVAVLKDGAEVGVEWLEGSWYRVSLSDGRTGYIHQTLLDLLSEPDITVAQAEPATEQKMEVAEEEPVAEPVAAEEDSPKVLPDESAISTFDPAEAATPTAKPPPSNRADDGERWVFFRWFVVALCIFILGWIFGGNYYLRRDRIERSKLRF